MQAPLFVRQLTKKEQAELEAGRRSSQGKTIRNALAQLGVRWKRAKHWITSPDPDYVRKKKRRDALIRLAASHPTWVLGFQDEVWWSRLANLINTAGSTKMT